MLKTSDVPVLSRLRRSRIDSRICRPFGPVAPHCIDRTDVGRRPVAAIVRSRSTGPQRRTGSNSTAALRADGRRQRRIDRRGDGHGDSRRRQLSPPRGPGIRPAIPQSRPHSFALPRGHRSATPSLVPQFQMASVSVGVFCSHSAPPAVGVVEPPRRRRQPPCSQCAFFFSTANACFEYTVFDSRKASIRTRYPRINWVECSNRSTGVCHGLPGFNVGFPAN